MRLDVIHIRKMTRIFTCAIIFLYCGIYPAYAIKIDVGSRPSLGSPVEASDFTNFLVSFKGLAMAVTGVCTITAVLTLCINIAKLSVSADNDMARQRAWKGIGYSGLALAIFGGATTLIGVFWNIFS